MARKFQIKRGLKANLPTLAQGEFAMTTDSGAEALWLGNGSENLKIPLHPTASDVGAEQVYRSLSDIGCTGASTPAEVWSALPNGTALYVDAGALKAAEWNLPHTSGLVVVRKHLKNSSARGEIEYHGKTSGLGTRRMYLGSTNIPDGVWHKVATTETALLKTDKPAGSYTGNKTIPRTVSTGGTGSVVAIRVVMGDGSMGPVYYVHGDVAIKGAADGTVTAVTDHAAFHDGVLTINHLNLNGTTSAGNMKYYYQVL